MKALEGIPIIIVVIYSLLWAKYHAKQIKKSSETYRESVVGYAVRIMVFLSCAWASTIIYHRGDVPYPIGMLEALVYALLCALLFWIWFDIFLNRFRGKSFDYVSTTNGKFFDKVFKGSFLYQIVAKGLIGIFLIILLRLIQQ